MSNLPEALFRGEDGSSASDLARAVVRDFNGDIDRMLAAFSGNSSPTAVIGITLSGNGRQVVDGRLMMRDASEPREVTFSAGRFWPDVDPAIALTIALPRLSELVFVKGTMSTAFLPDSQLRHAFRHNPQEGPSVAVLADELGDRNIGDFCVRVVCHIDKSSSETAGILLRYYFVLYPATEEQMRAEAPECFEDPAWPGFRLADGRIPLGPRPTIQWRCPIVPAILANAAMQEGGTSPPAAALRAAIAGIINTQGAPDGCKHSASLREKWDRVGRAGLGPDKRLPFNWPAAEVVIATPGRQSFLLLVHVH
jgi:hypothetical protein